MEQAQGQRLEQELVRGMEQAKGQQQVLALELCRTVMTALDLMSFGSIFHSSCNSELGCSLGLAVQMFLVLWE
jgi:hypothetical protein